MAKSKRTGNQTLASAIESMVGRMDKGGGGYRKALVVSAWEAVAGPQIASHAHGAYLKDDELVIFMDSPIWATEYQAMAETVRVAINEEIGREAVRTLRFTVSKRPPSAAFLGKDEPEPSAPLAHDEGAELSDSELERIREEAAGVEDQSLREALVAARIASLRTQKGQNGPNEP